MPGWHQSWPARAKTKTDGHPGAGDERGGSGGGGEITVHPVMTLADAVAFFNGVAELPVTPAVELTSNGTGLHAR